MYEQFYFTPEVELEASTWPHKNTWTQYSPHSYLACSHYFLSSDNMTTNMADTSIKYNK
jgi:hypothetical protein